MAMVGCEVNNSAFQIANPGVVSPGSDWRGPKRSSYRLQSAVLPLGPRSGGGLCPLLDQRYRRANLLQVHVIGRILARVTGGAVVRIALRVAAGGAQSFQRKILQRIGADELPYLFHRLT